MNDKKIRLLTPGPVPIPTLVREALSRPIIHHRTKQFEDTLRFCLDSLKNLFATNGSVFIQTSTGSGGMESALVNTLNPGDEVLAVVSGKFGERWAYMAERFGLKVHRLEVQWGEAVSLTQFEAALEKRPNVKAVLSQACETSTATLHPIKEMSKLIHERTNALFLVDAITAMGCLQMPMKEWDLDVVIAGSQKAFMLPTGLAFVGVSKRAWDIAQKNLQPKFYWDWMQEAEANEKNQTFFSSPTSLIFALHVVMSEIERVGLGSIKKRCDQLAQGTRAAAVALGLDSFSKSPSPSVTALLLPASVPGEKLRDWLENESGITVMGGQDRLKNKVLRVGHMGDISDEDMQVLFEALAKGIDQFDKTLAAMQKLPIALTQLNFHLAQAKRIFT
jgi:aspartate aminotransferase-like enzyme